MTLQEATGSSTRRSILNQDNGQAIATLQEAMGEKAFKAAWAEGQAMTMEQVNEFAMAAINDTPHFPGELSRYPDWWPGL